MTCPNLPQKRGGWYKQLRFRPKQPQKTAIAVISGRSPNPIYSSNTINPVVRIGLTANGDRPVCESLPGWAIHGDVDWRCPFDSAWCSLQIGGETKDGLAAQHELNGMGHAHPTVPHPKRPQLFNG